MPYTNRIKTLEESYRLIDIQISNIENAEMVDLGKLAKLRETKNIYLTQLRDLRKAQYEEGQSVRFDDDH